MKRLFQIVFGLLLAAVLIAVTFWNTEWDQLRSHLASLAPRHYLVLVAGMCMGVAHVLVRAIRWRTLLEPVRSGIPLYPLFATTALGYAFSLVGTRAGGEILRPALLGLREKTPISAGLGTIAVERLLDLVALLVLGAVALLLPSQLTGVEATGGMLTTLRGIGGMSLAGGLALLVLLALAASRRESLSAWTERRREGGGGRLIGALVGFVSRLLQGAEALRSRRLLLSLALQSIGVWLVVGVGVWLMLLGCGISWRAVPFPGIFILLPALAFGIGLPTPGGVGSYHLVMKATLAGLFGVDANDAAAASLLHHAATWLPLILLAAVLMVREGLGVADLSRSVREAIATSSGGEAR
jgi:uncharacterized protein (TIRG00374 family)